MAVFGDDWVRWKGYLSEGCTILIKAKCAPNRKGDSYFITINDIQYLQTVKEKQIDKFTITMTSDSINDTVVSDLTTLFEDSPGDTQLFIQIIDSVSLRPITLRSRKRKINVKRDLLMYIESIPGMMYKIN